MDKSATKKSLSLDIKKAYIFNSKEIENYINFYNVIKKVHYRLISEGHLIKNGEISAPHKITR